MISLSAKPLALEPVVRAVAEREHGGLATFLGTVRRESDRRPVVALVYEAYEELALREMAAVAEEAGARFGAKVAVVHRVGRVEAGDPSVAVAASARHRPAAFAACRFLIDEIKARVPIWKQTVFVDGTSSWVDGREQRAPVPGGRSA